jgi:hypothetical protein
VDSISKPLKGVLFFHELEKLLKMLFKKGLGRAFRTTTGD